MTWRVRMCVNGPVLRRAHQKEIRHEKKMAGGNPEEDPMQVEKVLDDTENDSDTAAGEGDAAEGFAAGKGSGRKPSKKAKISIIQKNAALHHWDLKGEGPLDGD
ncbi:hypothetical protein T484DRAFT_1907199 [Baffinella frigidus]|nr:hypothetical protein T484DRAFT_1907199 [Cryptophyta sp. CCMP2293]